MKVEILQRGKTDTQEWCLIKHPKQLGFHYRIPSRWLDNKPAQERPVLTYQKNIIAFPFKQLEKLALFVNCKFQNISFNLVNRDIICSDPKIITKSKLNGKEDEEEDQRNLEQYSPGTENEVFFKTSMDINFNKQKE